MEGQRQKGTDRKKETERRDRGRNRVKKTEGRYVGGETNRKRQRGTGYREERE